MTEDFAEVEVKNQQSLEGVDFTKSGELLLTHIGIELATPQLADISPLKLAHYMAVENWLTEYKPKPDASNLEQVRGYLEAFHHLCEVEAWETASKILFIPSNLFNNQELHQQLGAWGYYQEQVDIYSRLLNKIDQNLDCIFLHGLGSAYCFIGQFQPAIHYHQKQLEVASKTHNRKAKAQAHGGLGRVYAWCLNQYNIAIQHYHQELIIARELGDKEEEFQALYGLANTYSEYESYKKWIKYFQQALAIANEIGNCEMEGMILGALGSVYTSIGRHKQAIKLLQKQLDISRETNNKRQEWSALHNLGRAVLENNIEDYQNALDYYSQALKIIREIGDKFGESLTLENQASTFARAGKHEDALNLLQQLLTPKHQLFSREREGWRKANISYAYGCLKYEQAINFSKEAIQIARDINNQELYGFAFAMLANAYWQRGKYIRGLILVVRSMIIIPPWKSANGQLIFRTTIKEIIKLFLSYFQFSKSDNKPREAYKNRAAND